MIKEKAFAKINLTLDVINKREDGYHNIKSVMSPISLYDELYFFDDEEIILESECDITDNIILKAAHLLKEEYNVKKGARIKLIKRIPIAAGLAGGSADCSATLRGLNLLWDLKLDLDELAKLSARLGSDTIFCMYNRLAYVEGRGEKITFIPSTIESFCLLIKPYFGVSTKEIFQNHINNYNGDEDFKNFVYTIDQDNKKLPLYNNLLETTMNLYPDLKNLYDEVYKLDNSVMMSGSGPTLYILSNDRVHLNTIYRKFISHNIVKIVKLGVID